MNVAQSAKPTVSIIIPVFNGESTLDRALTSIKNAVAEPNYPMLEIIVIDDCSNDQTPSLLEKWSHKSINWSFRSFRHETNSGPGKARNTGLDAATGTWVYLLDVDDELNNDVVNIAQNHDGTCSCILNPYVVVTPKGTKTLKPAKISKDTFWDSMSSRNAVAIRSIIIRRTRIKNHFSKTSYLEDWEFWLRNPQIFEKACYDDRPLSTYHMSLGTLSSQIKNMASRRIEIANIMLEHHSQSSRAKNNWRLQGEIGEVLVGKKRFINFLRFPVSPQLLVKAVIYQLFGERAGSRFRD